MHGPVNINFVQKLSNHKHDILSLENCMTVLQAIFPTSKDVIQENVLVQAAVSLH